VWCRLPWMTCWTCEEVHCAMMRTRRSTCSTSECSSPGFALVRRLFGNPPQRLSTSFPTMIAANHATEAFRFKRIRSSPLLSSTDRDLPERRCLQRETLPVAFLIGAASRDVLHIMLRTAAVESRSLLPIPGLESIDLAPRMSFRCLSLDPPLRLHIRSRKRHQCPCSRTRVS
jgi:hypothetical protein